MTFSELVARELAHARASHEKHPSTLHSLAVLRRELEELADEVHARHRCDSRLVTEAAQVAAMCQRLCEDSGLI